MEVSADEAEFGAFDAEVLEVTDFPWAVAQADAEDRAVDTFIARPETVIRFWAHHTGAWQGWPHPGHCPPAIKDAVAAETQMFARDRMLRHAVRCLLAKANKTSTTRFAQGVLLMALSRALEKVGAEMTFTPEVERDTSGDVLPLMEVESMLRRAVDEFGLYGEQVEYVVDEESGLLFNPQGPILICTMRIDFTRNPVRKSVREAQFMVPSDPAKLTRGAVEKALSLFSKSLQELRDDETGEEVDAEAVLQEAGVATEGAAEPFRISQADDDMNYRNEYGKP